MDNNTLNVIAERYSCRSFQTEMPTDKELKAIADAAVAAPSAMNRQAWRVIVVQDRELISDMEEEGMRIIASWEDQSTYERIMSRGGKLFYDAPCMVMLPIDPIEHAGAVMDCGILAQTVALAATSIGLGNVICGLSGLAFAGDKADEFKKRLGFPPGFEFGIAVLIGYAKKQTAPHEPDHSKISYVG